MRLKPVISVLIALCLAVQCSACSLMFMKTTDNPKGWTQCSSGYAAPIVDSGFGLGFGAAAVLIPSYSNSESDEYSRPNYWDFTPDLGLILNTVGGIVLSVTAIIYLVSAVYGYYHASECSKVKEAVRGVR